jgi:Ca2+-binding RTX toxin-like protein
MKKKYRGILIVVIIGATVLILLPVMNAFTAANTVPLSRADKDSIGLGVNELQPPQCVGLGLTNIVDVSAGENGTSANDLILGTPGNDIGVRGGAGNDCILGGGGNDRLFILFFYLPGLWGEDGNDVIIGGPGADVCAGGAGSDTFYSCETTY